MGIQCGSHLRGVGGFCFARVGLVWGRRFCCEWRKRGWDALALGAVESSGFYYGPKSSQILYLQGKPGMRVDAPFGG